MTQPISDRGAQFEKIISTLPAGDIAELGVFEGGSAIQLARYGRTVWAFDTFDGIPQTGFIPELDFENPPGKFRPAATFDVPNIKAVKGEFLKTLPTFDPEVRLAFAYIDCDNYNSYVMALWFVASRLIPGGCFVCDDFCCLGARKAMHEFVAIAPQWTFRFGEGLFYRPLDSNF